MKSGILILALAATLLTLVDCGGSAEPEEAARLEEHVTEEDVLSSLDDLPEELTRLLEPWTGDLDGMVERRLIRLLTVHNPMLYSLDGPRQRGIVYEVAGAFEKQLNKRLRRGRLKVNLVIIPLRRDQLIPALVEGRGDIISANLTITPERLEQVAFSQPVLRDVNEIVVSGPAAEAPVSLEGLSGGRLWLRGSSSYWASVERLNGVLTQAERDPVQLVKINPFLEDHDLLEMVNAGLLGYTVVDNHKAEFWARVLDRITLHPDLTLREGGEIAWAFRKDSPKLEEEINHFVRKHRKGTLFGNVVYNRYLEDTSWIDNALAGPEKDRLGEVTGLFRKYGEMYGFDWRMLAAQGFQESGLDQSKRSHRGAVGVMQIKPATAKEVGIDDIDDIDDMENNIHAGVKYLRHICDHYFDEEQLDPVQRHLLALAAYNVGPTRIRKLRRVAVKRGYDPDRWFDNMEVVVARNVGSEPIRYVSNIVKYYVAYEMIPNELAEE